MSKTITYTQTALDNIERYIVQYRKYFHEIYSDTGIWAEAKILESYSLEAQDRKREILHLIDTRLSPSEVFGRTNDNMVILQWRSKYLFIHWEDEDDLRIITDIQIR